MYFYILTQDVLWSRRCPVLMNEDWNGEPFEWGTLSQERQGKRSDLAAVVEAIKADAPLDVVAEEYMAQFIKYHRGIEIAHGLHALKKKEPRPKPVCIVRWGVSGSGKTYKIQRDVPLGTWEPEEVYKVSTGDFPSSGLACPSAPAPGRLRSRSGRRSPCYKFNPIHCAASDRNWPYPVVDGLQGAEHRVAGGVQRQGE